VDGYPIIHAESDNLRPIRHYIERINAICTHYGCERGVIWLPHDARAKTLQTGKSIVEQFLLAGIRPQIVPSLDVLDGIAAARMLFPEIYFNSTTTTDLVEALMTYRREWDEDKKAFRNKPVEDWSVHYADTFRYFAIIARKLSAPREETPKNIVTSAMTHYPFTLEELWETSRGARNDRIQ
jgi:phage terminase large subunit